MCTHSRKRIQQKTPCSVVVPYFKRQGRKPATARRDFLAVIRAVTPLRAYLKGTCFTILTDDEALRTIVIIADTTGKLARRRLRLSEFQFHVLHSAKIRYKVTDVLSPLRFNVVDKPPLHDNIPVFSTPQETIACAPKT